MRANNFSRLILAAITSVALTVAAERADAQHVGVSVGIALPPPIVFHAAPQLIALPGTYVYAVPDYEAEIFFVDGFWWRPWEGRWYRSAYYDRGWEVYGNVPYFYTSVPRDWRVRYHNRRWGDRPWNYERIGYSDVQRNWSTWKKDKHWDRAVRDTSRDDYRVEKSGGYEKRLGDEKRGSYDKGATMKPSKPAPSYKAAPQKSSPQKAAPMQHRSSERGPARTTKPHSSGGNAPSKVHSSGGDGRAHGSGGGSSKAHSSGGGNPGGGGSKGHSSGGGGKGDGKGPK